MILKNEFTIFFSNFTGMFNGPDIRRLMKNNDFDNSLDQNQLIAWNAIKDVIENVLGKKREADSAQRVKRLLKAFEELAVNMSLKIHFLHHHMDWFENQLSTESDEQGERFHQVALTMETRYRGKKLDSMLGDLCWWLKRTTDEEDTDEEQEPETYRDPQPTTSGAFATSNMQIDSDSDDD